MLRVAVRDELVTAHDAVLVAKARSADVAAAHPDRQPLVEVRRAVVADVNLRRQRFHAALADRLISAGVFGEMLDSSDLEPDDERRVVRDALRIGFGEPNLDVGTRTEEKPSVDCTRASRYAAIGGGVRRMP